MQKKYLTLGVRRRTNSRRDAGLNASSDSHVARIMGTLCLKFELTMRVSQNTQLGALMLYSYLTSDKEAIKIESEVRSDRRRINAYRATLTPELTEGGSRNSYLGLSVERRCICDGHACRGKDTPESCWSTR